LNFNIIYDTSVNSAPAAFKTAITAVVQFFQNTFTNPITVTIDVGWGEINNQALPSGALGASLTYFNSSSYSQIRTALAQHATSADQISAVNSLPAGDPTGGGNYWVTTAAGKALGLAGTGNPIDGYVGFGSSFPFDYDNSNGVSAGTYDFYGVVAHEFTEVMGRSLFVGTHGIGANAYTPMDLFHYSSPGARDFVGTTPGYFSLNGGATNLGNFNTNPNGDFGDWASSVGRDSFLAFSSSGVVNAVSQNDLRLMNALGYGTTSGDTTAPVLVRNLPLIDGVGRTALISPNSLAFNDAGNSNAQVTYTIVTGPAFGTLLKSGSATFSFTQADIDNGLLTYRENGSNVSSDSFAFQVSDPAGNHTATQSFQFQIAPVTVIEAFGSTSLGQVTNQFFLYDGGGYGPALKFNGAPVVAGQFGAWAAIAAEPIATGYEVAWKMAGADQYTVWTTDGSGNYTSNTAVFSGASPTLEGLEPSFQQDLNGDGVIGTGPGSLSSASLPVGTGDFNGDGNPDMLWLNADDTLTIHEMNGSSVIGAADLPAPPPSWHLVGTGDLNGDGKSDILWQNSGGEVGIWEMNGTSIASAVSPGNPGAAWEFQGASDVDGDGKDDLLFMNPITNQTQTWLMNGTQVTAMQAPLAAPQSSGPVLSETEFYLPAESATGMAGDISPIRTSTLPDAGTAGLLLTRT
jgi:hypothetical protein